MFDVGDNFRLTRIEDRLLPVWERRSHGVAELGNQVAHT